MPGLSPYQTSYPYPIPFAEPVQNSPTPAASAPTIPYDPKNDHLPLAQPVEKKILSAQPQTVNNPLNKKIILVAAVFFLITALCFCGMYYFMKKAEALVEAKGPSTLNAISCGLAGLITLLIGGTVIGDMFRSKRV